MLRFVKHLSIRYKLHFIVLLSSSIALLVSIAIFSVYDLISFRKSVIQDFEATAGIIASQSSAAVMFNDAAAAGENLKALRAKDDVINACIHDADGNEIAHFINETQQAALEKDLATGEELCKGRTGKHGHGIDDPFMEVSHDITVDGNRVGDVFFRYSLSAVQDRIMHHLMIAGVGFLLALGAVFLFSARLLRLISAPVNDLLQVAEKVSQTQDYTLRAHKENDDELGKLIDKFNTMLAQIGQRDRDLQQATRAAELANRMKSEFLANMSHELRTPLNSLLILAESFADNESGNLTPNQVEAAKIIHGSGSDLLTLINDILDLAKVEAGRMEMHREPIMLSDIADAIRRKYTHVAESKRLGFKVTVAEDLPELFYSDRIRLEQILRNFLANAFKFTYEGSVTLRFHRPGEHAQFHVTEITRENAIAVSVDDTGIGIPVEKKEIIFEAFKQADASTTRRYGGTGLGLAISRELARLLGGEIHLKSEEGRGSVFTLFLPLDGLRTAEEANTAQTEGMHQSAEAANEAEISAQTERMHQSAEAANEAEISAPDAHRERLILVIEDDVNFVNILRPEIERKGFKCLSTATGREGIELAVSQRPDTIILDIGLPDISGLKIIERLKQDARTAAIPVYIMSVHDENAKAAKLGAIGYLNKPVSKEQLEHALSKLAGIASGEMRRVLVVEDDPVVQDHLAKLLSQAGKEVTVAGTGGKALDVARSQPVDCMILDLGLPDMSGLEVLEVMARNGSLPVLPVIVYSARDLNGQEEAQLVRYAVSYIHKNGHAPEHVLDALQKNFKTLAERNAAAPLSSISPSPDTPPLSVAEPPVAAPPAPAKPKSPASGKTVLVVDDDMRNTFALSKILRDRGFQVLMASNGQQALEALESNPKIDLVLMDIMMPVMDGYEAIQRIRSNSRLKELPVIAVTAKAMQEDKEKCLKIGATDYLSKPIDKQQLFAMMARHCGA